MLLEDKCLPAVKFHFIAFLPRTSLSVLSAVISGLFVFAEGGPNSAGSFFPEERVHNSLKTPMRHSQIVHPSILLSDVFIFLLDVRNVAAHQNVQF